MIEQMITLFLIISIVCGISIVRTSAQLAQIKLSYFLSFVLSWRLIYTGYLLMLSTAPKKENKVSYFDKVKTLRKAITRLPVSVTVYFTIVKNELDGLNGTPANIIQALQEVYHVQPQQVVPVELRTKQNRQGSILQFYINHGSFEKRQ